MPYASSRRRFLDENTMVPISLLIVFVSLAFWLGKVQASVSENAKRIEAVAKIEPNNAKNLEHISRQILEMNRRLGVIEGKIEVILQSHSRD